MGHKIITIDLDDVDPNGVFEDQTLGGAGNFSLDGAGVSGGVWTSPDGIAKQIGFESTGNISGVTFTVTGFADEAGHLAITEALAGPNNSTVETSNYFYSITSIAASGAVGTNTEAGPVDEAVSQIIPVDWRGGELSVYVGVTGTINWTLEQSFSDINDASGAPFVWIGSDDTAMVAATSSQSTTFYGIPRALRVKVNSYSSGAALEVALLQRD